MIAVGLVAGADGQVDFNGPNITRFMQCKTMKLHHLLQLNSY